jgi:hypothetical protein
MNLHDAIRELNPSVVVISGEDAFDKDRQPVAIDLDAAQQLVDKNSYKEKRFAEYPDFKDYLDGIVKGDQAQIQAYIDACLAVKQKYPKPQ